MTFLAGYLIFLVVFGVIDVIWLSLMAGALSPDLGRCPARADPLGAGALVYFAFRPG